MRAPDDLPIELDHHRARVKAQVPEQVGGGGRTWDATRLAVNQDLELDHRSPVHGKSIARVAAAGSGANQSARIAATP